MNQEIIEEANKYFGGDIKYVKGNGDWDLDLPDKAEVEFNNKKIGFTHFPDLAKKMAQSGKFDLVFYGHTHRPWDELVPRSGVPFGSEVGKSCHMINPGELAGQFYKPSFAIYDTNSGKLELKILSRLERDPAVAGENFK